MPVTITELYETASKAMLERVDRKERGAAASAAAVLHLTRSLEATFFEAHATEARDFGDEILDRAARSLSAPNKLKGLNQLSDNCVVLPAEAKEALRVIRERVTQDRLPLLSLAEPEPLLLQSSHLSFQEYFTVLQSVLGSIGCLAALPLGSGGHSGRTWSSWVVKMGSSLATGSCAQLVLRVTSLTSPDSSVMIVRR